MSVSHHRLGGGGVGVEVGVLIYGIPFPKCFPRQISYAF